MLDWLVDEVRSETMEESAAAAFKTNCPAIENKDKSRSWALIDGYLAMFEGEHIF